MIYQKSNKHIDNINAAAILGRAKYQEIKNKRIALYYETPNKCTYCNTVLVYNKKTNKFCSSSCAASSNNLLRGPKSIETRDKISNSIKNKITNGTYVFLDPAVIRNRADLRIEHNIKTYSFNPTTCSVCNCKLEYDNRHRKTCSRDCRIIASTRRTYRNGSRKTINYNGIVLESSWELKMAIYLDANAIKWSRPKPIRWVDNNNKSRLYYPDFYLIDFDLYLDPKNPYCMEKDKEKMECIRSMIKIVYGDINDVIKYINEYVVLKEKHAKFGT